MNLCEVFSYKLYNYYFDSLQGKKSLDSVTIDQFHNNVWNFKKKWLYIVVLFGE